MTNNILEDRERLLTAKEAGLYLGLAEGTVRNKANRGEIPFVRLGVTKDAPLRFRRSELDKWIADAKAATASPAGAA